MEELKQAKQVVTVRVVTLWEDVLTGGGHEGSWLLFPELGVGHMGLLSW